MGRSRAGGDDDGGGSGNRPKRRKFSASAWQDAVGGSSGATVANGDGSGTSGGGRRKGVYHCNYCQRDVTGEVRIKCARCIDFDLCVECFLVGASVNPHLPNHPYHIMDTLNFPIVQQDWIADEELLLLEGLEMYGPGNWAEVAEHVGSKTKAECRAHYLHNYLAAPSTAPLPDLSSVRKDPPPANLPPGPSRAAKAAVKAELQQAALYTLPPPLVRAAAEAAASASSLGASLPGGFNEKRLEFDPEYDNEAEAPIAELEFTDADSPADRQLKLKMLHIYYARLEERARRKAFVLERGLLDPRKLHGTDRKRSRDEMDLFGRCRVFARFLSPEQHSDLVNSLTEEQRLRKRIQLLQEFRAAGCRTLDEGERYLHYKSPPTQLDSSLLSQDKLDVRFHPGADLLSSVEGALCSRFRLLPAQYLRAKEVLIQHSAVHGQVSRAAAHRFFKLSAAAVDAVFTFLCKQGWLKEQVITAEAPSGAAATVKLEEKPCVP